jgi:hypothetical protein
MLYKNLAAGNSGLIIEVISQYAERQSLLLKMELLRLQTASRHTPQDIQLLSRVMRLHPQQEYRRLAIAILADSTQAQALPALRTTLDLYKEQIQEKLAETTELADILQALIKKGVRKTARLSLDITPRPPLIFLLHHTDSAH